MALRKRFEEGSGDSGVEPDRSLLSKEQRDQRISLFLRDFDHQAKENLQDMKKELASLLQMAEKAFRVELLAIPTVVRKMRRRDLIDLKEEAAAATVLKANDCSVGELSHAKLVRTNSKRVKVTTIVEYKDEKEETKTQTKKASQKVFKANSLTSLASTTKGKQGPLSRPVSAFSTRNARTLGRSASMREQSVSTSKCPLAGSRKFAQSGPSKSASASERIQAMSVRSTSMPLERPVPFVNIPLADGQTLCSAGEDLQNINVELLHDDTVQHIHTLVNQLTVLCGKATVKSS